MKRRTKVFLITSAAVVFLGIILCLAGAAVGSAAGEQIFPENTEQGRCYTYYFGDSDIGRVNFNAVKAQINIIGKAERSYIEVINFNENLSTFTSSNAVVTFRESPDVSSALRFWESGFTFKGLRYLIRSGGDANGGIINVYLAEDVKVKAFDLTVESGKVTVTNLDTPTDYNISVGSGSVTVSGVSTTSAVSVSTAGTSSSTVSMENVSAQTVSVKSQTAVLTAENIKAKNCDVVIRTGSAALEYSPLEDGEFSVEVNSVGKLVIDGCADYIDTYKYTPEKENEGDGETAYVRITGADLSVDLNTPLPDAQQEEDGGENRDK